MDFIRKFQTPLYKTLILLYKHVYKKGYTNDSFVWQDFIKSLYDDLLKNANGETYLNVILSREKELLLQLEK